MPIYEYYCPDNHTIYQFYAKTLAQGRTVPRCPDNPKFRMQKAVSAFAAITGGGKKEAASSLGDSAAADDVGAGGEQMQALESALSQVDENDPKAMARIMRRMSEMAGEQIDGEMEEVVRKLEEGGDPEALEAMLSENEALPDAPYDREAPAAAAGDGDGKERRHRFRVRATAPRRDPALYDYDE